MKLNRYLKDRWIELIAYIIFGVLICFLMLAFAVNDELVWLFAVLYIMLVLFNLIWDFTRKRSFYDSLISHTEQLDKKYLVLETLEQPQFYEGELLYQNIYDVNKSMCEHVKEYQESLNDFKDYLEMWVHEAKLPIASLLLMCHNNKDMMDKRFAEQLRRLDAYTEQVLYYVRCEHAESDYLIKENMLNKLVAKVAIQNKDDLLENNIDIRVENVKLPVMTDGKWMEFILNQLVSNSMKYRRADVQSQIRIYAEDLADRTVLHVWDNGRGIVASDISRIFEKSFTGENGRTHVKSTGMGLYIVKQLCRNLGHTVEIASVQGEWTDVSITFAKNDFLKM
ncbi:MAG: sensor histidine kinase [Lachnospiraceae bacterium]|nr:sensor histidine kinase [Lachnospiraceae bacterium]